jgi:hypothetical protein
MGGWGKEKIIVDLEWEWTTGLGEAERIGLNRMLPK